ncbi:Sterol regulatory element-binding protein cleavage-activating protein [Golovinomyces cichoracearum]|uniref:Sterol regulatory element-binding protein cleavage-activating protein n=1 Tax=Golovinomyces cichoracearum TaxID=62708 RepID=A0A420IJE7_9PEZI|nr:Sterol regulatory element-binding protein cleavage-activating protein [Golovinomyces cichoracearum]
MIWYLLYPFRGTTEIPILSPDHPLRYTFTQLGYKAARHYLTTLLVSVAIAVALLFPFPFLYTNDFTNGSSNLPHHVWTSAQQFEGPATTSEDVVMRSVWVHGSYMKALQTNILSRALEIQDYLLGPTIDFNPQKSNSPPQNFKTNLTIEMRDALHAINGVSNQSWFFHSPLLYWSCSLKNIETDDEILNTINQNARKPTSVNVTLRHSIVFSGKRFENHRLVAADALVITLVHIEKPLGNTLYEFRFQPLSLKDNFFLGIAYLFTFIHFMLSLSKLLAFRSRIGLIFAVVLQIGISIVASFNVCAVFKIDLSKIPREAYPLVVLIMGTKNISRLINAVIVTRSEDSTAKRIGEALGKTGHESLSGISQNLAILWALSRNVHPQITAFCSFAAIALSFDLLFLVTFFCAVLSVDLQRIELIDALNKIATYNSRMIVPPAGQMRSTWANAIFTRIVQFSSRIAGTAFLIGFAVIVHGHFFENESICQTIYHIVGRNVIRSKSVSILSVDIHQARTPTGWLRMQDHQTAHEVIQIVKPHANSYIARVYDPLIFVLHGSDRTPNEFGIRPLLPAVYDFMKHQFGYFSFTVITTVVAVSLFLNYLLWDETIKNDWNSRLDDRPLISLTTLASSHALDIVLLATSNEGVLATVGLDRKILIWNIRQPTIGHLVYDFKKPLNPFPVLAIALDNSSKWLAILSAKDSLFLWNIKEQRWGPFMQVQVQGHVPLRFFFEPDQCNKMNHVIMVRKNGLMSELYVDEQKERETKLSHIPLISIHQHVEKSTGINTKSKLFYISRKGSINVASRTNNYWDLSCIDLDKTVNNNRVNSILSLPSLNSVLAARECTIDLIDLSSQKVAHVFSTKKMQQNTIRCFRSLCRQPQCGSVGLGSLAIAYNCEETDTCILQVYLPRLGSNMISFGEASNTCCSLAEATENRFEIENPGQWEALQAGYLVGIRKRETNLRANVNNSFQVPSSILRRRDTFVSRISCSEQESWEIWAISSRGERYSRPLYDPMDQGHLLFGSLGPLKVIGRHTIAVCIGNVVKAISVGKENFIRSDDSENDSTLPEMAVTRIKRRKKHHLPKKKCH